MKLKASEIGTQVQVCLTNPDLNNSGSPSGDKGLGRRCRGSAILHGIAELPPSVESALQRANPPDALFSEEERHTGARGFVWSSTVENDFTVARQAIVFLFQLLRIHAKCAGDCFRVSLEIHRVPQINNHHFFGSVNFFF
jgi:hypothetical protein